MRASGVAELAAARALQSRAPMRLATAAALAPVAVAALTAGGCITHLPPRSTTHLQIAWRPSFDAAARDAAAAGKPLLAVLVAGEINGPC